MRALRKLAKVTLAFAVLLAIYLAAPASLLGIRPAYASGGPDPSAPLPVPEDPMGNRPSGGTPEITYDVDVRDGSLRVRVVDIWGPGKTPLVYRIWTARDGWVWNHHLDYEIVDTGSGVLAAMVMEPDGNRQKYRFIRECLYSWTGQGTQRVRVWAKEIGAYAVLETHDLYVGDPGGGGGGGAAAPSGGSTSASRTRPTPAPTKQPQLGLPDTSRTTSPFPTGLTTVEAARLGGAATMSSTSCSSPWVSNGFGRIIFGKGVARNYQDGRVTSQQDASGNQITWAYTTPAGADRPYVNTVTDPVNRVTSFNYVQGDFICTSWDPETGNCSGGGYTQKVSRATDPYGRQANYTYLSHGTPEGNKRLLVSATSPATTTTSYTYLTGTAYLSRVTNARSFQTNFTWNGAECQGFGFNPMRISRVTAPDGTFTQYACLATVSPPNVRVTVTDARGNNTIYNVAWSLSELGDIKDVTDALGRITRFQYDTRRNLTQTTDAKGNITTYQYNIRNNRTQKIVAFGSLNLTSTWEWDDFDNLLRVRTPRGVQENFVSAEYTYDAAHRMTMERKAVGQPEQSTTQFAYNAWGGLSAVTDPRGNVTQYTYNARRMLQTTAPPVGGATTYTYDVNDDATSRTDGNGRNWLVAYDVRRNPIRTTDPLNNQVQFTYDANGNRIRVTDARNNVTNSTLDNRDRITAIVDAANGTTAYVYDAVSNLTRITNARNAVTQFTYDQLNRQTQITDALGQNTINTYDEVGNLLTTRDRKNQLFTMTYDQAYRKTQVTVGSQTIQSTYDRNGNRLTMVDATGTTQYLYDKLDRQTRLTYPDGAVFQMTFDAAGNRTSMTNSKGVVTTYTYNPANWLTAMAQGTLTWTFGYDAAGNRTQLNQPNGTNTDYVYLNNNWLQSLTHRRSNTTLQSFAYTYDATGNRITQTDSTGTASFTYDALNRLTGAIYGGGTGTGTWSYDAVGNRIQQILPGNNVTNYTYDLNNRLTQAGTTTYSYDANGNMTSRSSGGTFVYDAWNRMTQTTVGGNTANYTYNGDGLKVRRSGHGAPAGGLENYYYVADREVLRTDASSNVVSQLDRDIFGNLLARRVGATAYYYAFDGIGSTTAVTDTAGTVQATMLYDAWGNQRAATGTVIGRHQFTGAEKDPTSNLYHMGARFYDPTIARWLSEDPIQNDYFNPMTLNFYEYANLNPLRMVDPSGKRSSDATPIGPGPVFSLGGMIGGRAGAELAKYERQIEAEVNKFLDELASGRSVQKALDKLGAALLNIFGGPERMSQVMAFASAATGAAATIAGLVGELRASVALNIASMVTSALGMWASSLIGNPRAPALGQFVANAFSLASIGTSAIGLFGGGRFGVGMKLADAAAHSVGIVGISINIGNVAFAFHKW